MPICSERTLEPVIPGTLKGGIYTGSYKQAGDTTYWEVDLGYNQTTWREGPGPEKFSSKLGVRYDGDRS